MNNFLFNISFILALIGGQLIKIPLFTHGGIIPLDFIVILMDIYGSFRLKLKFRKFPLWIFWATSFILISVISLTLTPLDLTLPEYYTSFSYTIRFSSYILLGLILVNGLIKDLEKKIFLILSISGVGLAFIGLLQLMIVPDLSFLSISGWDPHYFRTVSTFLDPNFLGAYLTLTLIVIFQKFSITEKWGIFFFSLVFAGLLTTFSRGAYLGFGAGFLALSFLNKSLKLLILTTLLSILLLSSYIFYQKVVAQVRNIDRTQSAEYRLNSWQQGLSIFEKHPVLGVGFNAYRYALKEYKMGNNQFLESHGASSNDSSLLYILATTGILGFILYLFFLGSLFWTGYKKYLLKNAWGIILLAGLISLSTQSFFSNTLFYPPLLMWLILVSTVSDSQVMVKFHKLLGRFSPGKLFSLNPSFFNKLIS